jgi:hypothetical protein
VAGDLPDQWQRSPVVGSRGGPEGSGGGPEDGLEGVKRGTWARDGGMHALARLTALTGLEFEDIRQ